MFNGRQVSALLIVLALLFAAGSARRERGAEQISACFTSRPLQKVDLNSASAADLEELPFIGATYARRIIEYREEHGRFGSIDELARIKGIGPKKMEKLGSYVVAGEK